MNECMTFKKRFYTLPETEKLGSQKGQCRSLHLPYRPADLRVSAETKWLTASFPPSCITALAKTQKSKEKKEKKKKWREKRRNKKGKDINVSSSTTGPFKRLPTLAEW